jgi:hypothetical protein
MIREMATQYGVAFKDAYNKFYSEFTRIVGTDIHLLYKIQTNMSKMDTLEYFEPERKFLTQFHSIIKNEYQEFLDDKNK